MNTAGRLANSSTAKYIGRNAAEAAGWVFKGKQSQGFLGISGKVGKFGTGMAALGTAFSVHSIYSGYQEEGIWGATKGAGTAILGQMAANAITNPIGLGLVGAAGLGFAGYQFGEAATKRRKEIRGLDMTIPNYSNIIEGGFTDRQRSLQALNNSSMNARMAIGNEASLLHTTYTGLSAYRR